MDRERDRGYYGVIEYFDYNSKLIQSTQLIYKDSRDSLYKTQKALLSRLKAQVAWFHRTGKYGVTKVTIVEAKVTQTDLSYTVLTPDDLK